MKITFWGAAGQVTGSMFLLEMEDGYKLLIDCGMDMENPVETMPVYPGAIFPFEASLVNVVALTHAHLDHSGRIPNLFREGFEGQVLCTSPTLDLAELLLNDSANLNRKRLNALHKRRRSQPTYQPRYNPGDLYLEQHVQEAVDRFVPIAFNKVFSPKSGLRLTFIPTGHLLGAANILVEVEENGSKKSILFSGDLGRQNYPLLPDPEACPQVDYLVCETTYGNRMHSTTADTKADLEKVIFETCVEKPGRLIIPAFSVGRTQAILFTLNQLFAEGRLPQIRIFADSPMAHRSNKIYEKYRRLLNQEARIFSEENAQLFDFEYLTYVENNRDSMRISDYSQPCIIISSSGMMEGGRIQHHIRTNLSNPYCTILMVGYSVEGTLGHQLAYGDRFLKVGHKEVAVHAEIRQTDAFSGHGDCNDLLRFVKNQAPEKLKNIFLVHGEQQSSKDFEAVLHENGYKQTTIPAKGQEFFL